MNDHELDHVLGTIGEERTRVSTPQTLRQRVHAVPLETPQRRSWLPHFTSERFGSMFSATKMVAGGAVVALFGGFLLSGFLPTGSGDEQVPVPGASASAAATASATATILDSTPDSTAAALLPGVDLDLEEIRAGIYRVLSDGEADLTTNVWDVQAAADGGVWVETHKTDYVGGSVNKNVNRPRFRNIAVRQLGAAAPAYQVEDPVKNLAPELRSADGQPALELFGAPLLVWNGSGWDERSPMADCSGAVDPDGACWTSLWLTDDAGGSRIQREDADGSTVIYRAEDLGLDADAWFGSHIAVADDGTVWVDVKSDFSDVDPTSGVLFLGGLASFDGSEWSTFRLKDDVRLYSTMSLEVAPDGTVWATQIKGWEGNDDELLFRTWDGSSWTKIGPVTRPSAWREISPVFADDGSVWLDPLTRYDGETIDRAQIPALTSNDDPDVRSFTFAPDGSSAWVVVTDPSTPESLGCDRDPRQCQGKTDGLYVITAEAFADAQEG